MLIECHIRRTSRKTGQPGSDINLGGASYSFVPNPDATNGDAEAHVCKVEDEAHVTRLLSIAECYTEYGEALKPPTPPEPVIVEIPDEPSAEDALRVDEDLDIELQMCETIIGMSPREAAEQLADLSEKALDQLATMEKAGQARETFLEVVAEELAARKRVEDEGIFTAGDDSIPEDEAPVDEPDKE